MVDGFIRDYNGTKYLALFGFEKNNAVFNKIRYLITRNFAEVLSHNFGKTQK